MSKLNSTNSQWVTKTKDGYERKGNLTADWEVAMDPISDDYTPRRINARDLFNIWVKIVNEKYPDNLVPIFWFVRGDDTAIFEGMPFQYDHLNKETEGLSKEDFLTYFTWPINSKTGEKLNWFLLQVEDKLWNSKRADKGGFIQEATGWKPSILQPFVYLPSLTNNLH
jgi:hypothetical protein